MSLGCQLIYGIERVFGDVVHILRVKLYMRWVPDQHSNRIILAYDGVPWALGAHGIFGFCPQLCELGIESIAPESVGVVLD